MCTQTECLSLDVAAPDGLSIHLRGMCAAGHHPLAVPAFPPPRSATMLEEQLAGRSPSPTLKRSQSPHRTARPDKPALKRVAPSLVPAAQTGTPAPGHPASPASNVSRKPGPHLGTCLSALPALLPAVKLVILTVDIVSVGVQERPPALSPLHAAGVALQHAHTLAPQSASTYTAASKGLPQAAEAPLAPRPAARRRNPFSDLLPKTMSTGAPSGERSLTGVCAPNSSGTLSRLRRLPGADYIAGGKRTNAGCSSSSHVCADDGIAVAGAPQPPLPLPAAFAFAVPPVSVLATAPSMLPTRQSTSSPKSPSSPPPAPPAG